MLLSLSIRNFVIIEKADLDFVKGLNVISGESGAGKSVLIDAILFVFGGKFDTEIIIKSSAEFAQVTAEFKLNLEAQQFLFESGFEEFGSKSNSKLEDIIVKRQHYSNGRKKFFINDQQVTQKVVQRLGGILCTMSLQHYHTMLSDSGSYIDLLDTFAGLNDLRKNVSSLFFELESAKKDLLVIESEQGSIERELNYIKFSLNELESIKIGENEFEKLLAAKNDLLNFKKNKQAFDDITSILEGKEVLSSIAQLDRALAKLPDSVLTKQLQDYVNQSHVLMSEFQNEISKYAQNLDSDDLQELDKIEERIFSISDFARKHKMEPSELGSYKIQLESQLIELESCLSKKDLLKSKIEDLESKYDAYSSELTSLRKSAAADLAGKITDQLRLLEFSNPDFQISIQSDKKLFYSSKGIDNVEFLFSSNPGVKPYSLDKIASGGECARIMLALSVCIMDKNQRNTIIFDEIDSGVSGKTAHAIGQKMHSLSKYVQVIAITHQPQVAAYGDTHFLAKKIHDYNTTNTIILDLNRDQRVGEMARMISGKNITELATKTADEYLKIAESGM